MPFVLAPILVSTFAISAATAATVASVATVAIGIGFTLISSLVNKPAQPKPSDGQVTINLSTAPRSRSYGRVKKSGNLMFVNTTAGFYGRIYAINTGLVDAFEEHWIDDIKVDLAGDEVTTTHFIIDGVSRAHINFRHGEDDPPVYAATHDAFPDLWTVDHLGRGVASVEMVLQQTPSKSFTDVFPKAGDTLYRAVLRASLIPDIDPTTGDLLPASWSDNAARVLLDYLTHPDGLRLDTSWILNAWETWADAIAICDEAMPLAAGGTEPRYRIWNTYTFDERPADVITRFLQACDAVIYPTPDRGIAIKVGKWEEPSVVIDDAAILGFTGFGRGRDILTTANTIRAQYTSPDDDYQQTDAEVWADEDDVAARGEIATDLQYFPAPSHAQCRRLMKIAAWRANPAWVGTLTCNLRALPAMGERFVSIVISELGVDDTFEILSSQLTIDATVVTGIEIQVQSFDPEAYAWSTDEEGVTPPVLTRRPRIAPERDLPMPSGVSATANGYFAVVQWDAYDRDFLTAEIRYRNTAEAQWSTWPVADGSHAARVGPLTLILPAPSAFPRPLYLPVIAGDPPDAPGSGFVSLYAKAGGGSASLRTQAGTSAAPVDIIVNIGSGVAAATWGDRSTGDLPVFEFQVRTLSTTTGRVSPWSGSHYITLGTEDWVMVGDGVAAAVDLNFADELYYQAGVGSTLETIVSVTRASAGYAQNAAGLWTSFGNNIARRTDRGLLVEEARTNRIRNNAMLGAVAGTPGTTPTNWSVIAGTGLVRQIVGTGTEDGIDYIDIRWSGTASVSGTLLIWAEATVTIAPAAIGQQWTVSAFERLIAGSFTGFTVSQYLLQEFNASSTQVATNTANVPFPTATRARTTATRTLINAGCAYMRSVRQFAYSAGAVVDLTLRIGWPQAEQGAYASSPIRTTGAVATRAADVVRVATPPSLGTAMTLYAAGNSFGIATSDQALVSANDGTVNNVWSIRRKGGNAVALLTAGGSSLDLTGAAMSASSAHQLAAAYTAGNQGLSLNGGPVVNGTSPLAPAGLATVNIGHGAGATAAFGGYLQRVAIWPQTRLTDAGLVGLTSA